MHLFFDLLITIGLIMTAYPAVILLYSRSQRPQSWEYKNKMYSLILSLIFFTGTAIFVWGSFIEPKIIVINYKNIDLEEIKKPIRIALISDMQIGSYKETLWIQKIVDKTLALHPDIVLLAGDQVDNATYRPEEFRYLEPLKQLAEQIPTYAIHGNHEYGIGGGKAIENPKYRVADVSKEAREAVEKLGIHYLQNDLEIISVNDEQLYLFGADEWWGGVHDFSKLNMRDNSDIPTILLMHNPAAIPEILKLKDIDIMLSGHTHGGQIRLPFIGPVARVEDVPAKWHKGLHNINNMKLFVTSGIGETGTRARLFNPPEIALLIIQ
ncbi:MAG TPA: hypothetical protein DCS29_02810 [Candidatus Magasanikbacteria bacterium]|nr:MAG: hypothetical protein A2479_03840 [Candidatus Magasanikbacteria bacterium RIFOXYC2_FULL_39_8]HAT03683.1 hypothetical protein [Candidatus Magasanikbacteria bacterium]